MGLWLRADPLRLDRIENELDHRLFALSGVGARGHQALGERRLHFHAGRQPAGRPRARVAGLLACLWRHGRFSAGRRCRKIARRMDDYGEPVSDIYGMDVARYGAFCVEPRIYPPDDRPILFAPLCNDLSKRAAVGRPSAQDLSFLPGDDRQWRALGRQLGLGGADLFRAERLHRNPDAQALQCLRHHR